MFCPSCGSEQRGPFCRSCGMDLRTVRAECERPDAISAPATSARDEIGRAVADKIREIKSAKDLNKVVEEILPGISEFLETPEEKSLRRIRAGLITTVIGLGVGLTFAGLGISMKETAFLFVACLGLTTFLLGLGIAFNGWLFTIPKRQSIDRSPEPSMQPAAETLPNLTPKASAQGQLFTSSVTEHTTHQLPERQSRAREAKYE